MIASVMVAAIAAMPVCAVFVIALTGGTGDLQHIVATVLPRASLRTLLLVIMTGLCTCLFGIVTAWLVTSFRFPLRRLLSVALVLPLAIPSYIGAYTFVEFLDFTGPVQSLYRSLLGFQSARDYWFFDVRSLGGAVLIMASVLYPYVYLACRSSFLMQGRTAGDVARTLGSGPLRTMLRVQLPMARPAIVIGLTLVTMETLNDIGAVEYLGVNTLTFSIYDTWLNRGSLPGAAQLALVLLGFVAVLMAIERLARRRQRFSASRTTGLVHDQLRPRLKGPAAWLALLACALPVALGFLLPFLMLVSYALRRLDLIYDPRLIKALVNSVTVSGAAALATVVIGFLLAYAARTETQRLAGAAGRLASLGYGMPGTVLAIGVLIPLAHFDNALDGVMRSHFGLSTGLLLSGTGFAIFYACTVRFLTMAEGTVEAGFQKLSPHLDMAARTLGRNRLQTLIGVLLPNMRPALLTAGLFVFVESMKELSATILLRPFNFNTLATLIYEDASRAQIENASIASLIVVLVGLVPVILVSRSLER
ncbi:iron ABC transporter permease [Rhizobium sp. SSA_523]|uniref:ABC transporter permease n=1 Tax=Rhizobium sp. SSA_523 TaxID=2952477 RepID=UPI002091CDB3|nr:iron ABC transporter permease [Rhizobium sp. SSA_523]MCO5733075.1 iron ABC transporter permease [Rhizobium sp. SSA_523]WKC23954.1 iron ABC transporter permease [Rhizobium sp. SSA_523]